MSMCCWFRCISEARAKEYVSRPALASEDAYAHRRVPGSSSSPGATDIDQSWQMLHYLLTGKDMYKEPTTGPLSFMATADVNINIGRQKGLAGCHILLPASVQATSEALSRVTHATLLDAWNDDEMEGLDLWRYERHTSTRDYCFSFLLPLKALFRSAATRGECVAVFYG